MMLLLMSVRLIGPFVDEEVIAVFQLLAPPIKAAIAWAVLHKTLSGFDRLIE
jgi:hypothetical protein